MGAIASCVVKMDFPKQHRKLEPGQFQSGDVAQGGGARGGDGVTVNIWPHPLNWSFLLPAQEYLLKQLQSLFQIV